MNNNFIKIGPIENNPLCGLCERVCISVKQVLDGCRYVITNETYAYRIENTMPAGAVFPYSFVQLLSAGQTAVSALSISEYDENCSRVTFLSTTPISVRFTDSNGRLFTANSAFTLERDVLLKIPLSMFNAYSIEVATNVSSRNGSFQDATTAVANTCVVQVVRVVTNSDIIVPSYGKAVYPRCNTPTQTMQCMGINEEPTFFNS